MSVISITYFRLRIDSSLSALRLEVRSPQSAIRNPGGGFRHSRWDALLVFLALAHGALLLARPSIPLIAVALWWNANTISHNFIHLPFFRSRALNRLFSWYLTALLGIPQTLWRERHLAHHGRNGARRKLRVRARISWHFGASAGQADARRRDAGDVLTSSRSGNAADACPPPRPAGLRLPRPANYCGLPVMIQLGMGAAAKCHIILARALSPAAATELALVLGVWSALATLASKFFFTVYLPGYLAGLGLCYLQGHYEHVRGTTSHYGSLYNLTFFNDGYHVEHHERPGEHWRYLPRQVRYGAPASPWPPVLRWLGAVNLELLERLVLRSKALQRFVLRTHERALVALLPQLGDAREIEIVGGGMFPRTALILRRLFPRARITIIDASSPNLETARYFLNGDVSFVHRHFDAGDYEENADLVVIPLSFTGDRAAIYDNPPARAVLVHDWIWKRHEIGAPVSLFLLKRLNLVKR